ncbi:MAG: sugar kinase [Eubacterium sp.]|nr:sugar kinase [Eubacterium sp.]
MDINIRPESECKFDMVSLGEVMLRFDPGEGRIRTARSFKVWEGGGEYNVARALHKGFGMNTAVITAIADNEIGKLLFDLIEQGGVSTELIYKMKTDAIGKTARNGLNFTERGFGIRGAMSCSDRAGTAISKATSEDFDFKYIFGDLGVRWLHTGGIYGALSETSAKTLLEAVKTAKKYGTVVSYDLNYRASLWDINGGLEKAREINKEIVKYVDVVIGSEEDFTACLGYEPEGIDEGLTNLDPESFKKMLDQVAADYPNLKLIANMLHTVKTASVNDWMAICRTDSGVLRSHEYKDLEVLDRVGIGDSFAAGFIYAIMKGMEPQEALEYGTAHGALVMTTPGDTSMASVEEVEAVINNRGARVKR